MGCLSGIDRQNLRIATLRKALLPNKCRLAKPEKAYRTLSDRSGRSGRHDGSL